MSEALDHQGDRHSCLSIGEADSLRTAWRYQAFGLRQARMPVLLLFFLSLVACRSGERLDPNDRGFESPITLAAITYPELAQAYNQTVEPFDALWARTDVVIEWREEPNAEGALGDLRREKGEGKLLFRRPGETALLVEKLGQIYLWAGSNREQYWLLDVSDSDAKRAFVGSFAKLNQPGGKRFPLPVRSDAVPFLLGLMPMPFDEQAEIAWPDVQLFDGQYLVEPPGMAMRMLIDAETFRPTRVDLLDAQGYSVLTAKLTGTFPVSIPGIRKSRWPSICERAEVYVSGYESRLTVAMDDATTDPRKVRDMQFDVEALTKALRINETISLDPQP